MNKKLIVRSVILALTLALIATVAFAALAWEHEQGHLSVRIDRYGLDQFHSKGFTGQAGIGSSTDVKFTKYLNCGYSSERVYIQAQANGNVMVKGGCIRILPTPAPTMIP